jgi:ABC-2 type transport system permease protein
VADLKTQGTLKTLFNQRKLLALMARQDMKSEYGKYRFGILWTLGEPLLVSALMWSVFTFIFQTTRGIALDPFIVYLATGMLPFAWLSASVARGPNTFRKYGSLLTFSKLPVVAWPMRSVTVGFAEFLMSIPVIVALTLAFGSFFTWGIVFFPIGLIAQFILCLGFSMLGASIGATFPDAQRMTALVVRILFWGSPILWFARDFGALEDFLYLNPFYGILDMYRASIWPDEILSEPRNYVMSGTVIVIIFASGLVSMKSQMKEIRRLG